MNIFSNKKNNFRQLSYSQSGEDRIVKMIFDGLGINKFTYMDIGAHHPYFISNTALFYELGMNGVNIEPDPVLFKEFEKFRKRDINLNIGIAETSGEADFYIISASTLNTFSKEEAEGYAKQGNFSIREVKKVKTESLQNIVNNYCNGRFPDFLTVDAEGIDELIVKSIDFNNNPPLVVCIETISFSTSGNGVKNTDIIALMESNGYLNYADTNINTIFVRKNAWMR